MDIGLREWLLLIGLVVIAAILFDGLRRMNKNKQRLKPRPEREEPHEVDDTPAYNGGHVHREPSLGDEPLADAPTPARAGRRRAEPSFSVVDEASSAAPAYMPPLHVEASRSAPAEPRVPSAAKEPPQEVLAITVIAADINGFQGSALMQAFLENALQFGEHGMFYRYSLGSSGDRVLFSVMNAVAPGTFDIERMDSFSTRAVSFFLCLPGPDHPRQAFDLMAVAARSIAHNLGGDVYDENRSVLTAQNVEHYRQRIAEFERRRALRR